MADVTMASGETTTPDEAAVGGHARWWGAVLLGAVAAVPFAWILSYAATLPFYLGLFFFMLFGLVIGAAMHRLAAAGRPYRSGPLVIGTALVVLIGWTGSVINESRDFPRDIALETSKHTRFLGDRTVQQFRIDVAENIRRFLRDSYPPGGTIGYVRWIILSGELTTEQISDIRTTQHPRQYGLGWLFRAIMSIVLLAFGIGSQTLPLRKSWESSMRAIDAVDAPTTE